MQFAFGVGDEALRAPAGVRDDFAVVAVGEVDGFALGDIEGQTPGSEAPLVVVFGDLDVRIGFVEAELRAVAAVLLEVDESGGDDVGARGGDLDGEDAAVQVMPGL